MKWIEFTVDDAYAIGLQDGHVNILEPSFTNYDKSLRIAYDSGFEQGKFWYDRLIDFYGA